ncbi:hypothetical protein M569_15855 [Genlisea aurea]|uniref:Uncharacterized protein n=1 Tax=Genlisea aurea TaxID=192259 RepID=S8DHW4_9LAMI|nr:hypothetical protein M569_15855 [Genlisea aurea]
MNRNYNLSVKSNDQEALKSATSPISGNFRRYTVSDETASLIRTYTGQEESLRL